MSLVIVWARLRCVILYVLYVEYVKITELLRVNTDKNVQFNSHGKIICTKAGAHYKEPATPIISQCSDIFTDLSIFKYFCHEIGQFQSTGPGGGGVLPYMGYTGMCGPKGYGFSAVLVINRVSNLADSGHK